MAEKVEFKRNVNNAVMGDINEGPRQSQNNVVNFTIGSKIEFQPLTKLQRQDVTSKVKEVVALGGVSPLEVYRVLLNNFGAPNMDAFPGGQYMNAMELLNSRIALLKKSQTAAATSLPTSALSEETMACRDCTRHTVKIKSMRRTNLGLCVALSCSVIFSGWLFYETKAHAADYSTGTPKDEKCYIAGKSYSIGYIERVRGSVPVECVASTEDMPAMWLPANRVR
ncbi:hypothetical protein [Janthinobacterium sp.]|uniref:hypothetical protein n=1 Tax=Janthinobacterium sp. TaxID=1871054 RepID=UPI0026080A11|nr:hypothetical protein [Janthinobacterium sp.]